MNTLDKYTMLRNKINDLEEAMSVYRRDLRHALKQLNNDEFHRIRHDADILAKELYDKRKRLERLEKRVGEEMRGGRPEPPESYPIHVSSDDD
jgi:TATA-binding protein-associated factor Taf7